MKITNFLTSMWVALVGFFIGLVQVVGLCPFSVGYMSAVCMRRKNVPLTYIAIMSGILLNKNQENIIRYGMILLGISLVLCTKSFDNLGRNTYVMAFFAGLINLGVNVSVAIVQPDKMQIQDAIIEAFIVLALAIIYEKALAVLMEDNISIAFDDSAAIAVIVLFATLIYGMPVEVGNIVVAEPFALFTILCAMYSFGLGIGLTWTCICGVVLSAAIDNSLYLTAWIPVAVISYALLELFHGRRIMFALLYAVSYGVCGLYFYEELLLENGIKTVFSALLFFVFFPGGFLLKFDKKLKPNGLEMDSPEWGRLILNRIGNLANAFKRIDYTMAYGAEAGVGFKDVGNIIDDFTAKLEQSVPMRKTIEARIIEELREYDIELKSMTLLRNEDERLEVYLTARIRRGRLVAAELVKKIVESHISIPLELNDESRNIVGRNYEVLCMHQKPDFKIEYAISRISKYKDEVSGDNYLVDKLRNGQQIIIIADGMGNGEKASRDSMALIDSLEELLNAGFERDMSIKIVNSFLAKRNRGETFATLDMLLVDLYTGCSRLYKQGAATTYVKRGEWLEEIKSTSLPVGVVEEAVCESCVKKLYEGDIVVMVSDGLLESLIVESKDEYMRDLLLSIDCDTPKEISEELIEIVKAQSGNRLKDDATLIVSKLVKSL